MQDCPGPDDAFEAKVWDEWNALPEFGLSPVNTIAKHLNAATAAVAEIVYPPDQFGPWNDSQEPRIPGSRESRPREDPRFFGHLCLAIQTGLAGPDEYEKWMADAEQGLRQDKAHISDQARTAANNVLWLLDGWPTTESRR